MLLLFIGLPVLGKFQLAPDEDLMNNAQYTDLPTPISVAKEGTGPSSKYCGG